MTAICVKIVISKFEKHRNLKWSNQTKLIKSTIEHIIYD